MKKLFASIAVVLLSLGFIDTVSAQVNFGVLGGASFSSAKPEDWKMTNLVQYHAGITCCINLPLGFAVQPEVLYHVKGSNVPLGESSKLDYAAGYVEVPVSLQWGPDLLVMRPYFELVPEWKSGISKSPPDTTGISVQCSMQSRKSRMLMLL